MKQFLFPAVFFKEDDKYIVLFPDLNITTEGDTVEEAFLFAKDSLKVYCSYVEKFDLDIDMPSTFESISAKNPKNLVMMIDCFVMPNGIKI
ncbi:MAG: toxin-antitoxin system, antitoxin component, HicB family protein [Clostridia bacterium]|nr:toxin-antitoxin system, antitoxin component, HicB family protein [Clostridia bacterium]